MELYLVQHGEAKPGDEDPARPLTEAGAAVVERMAVFAARSGVKVDEVRHSGKLRAMQTAEILAETLDPAGGVQAVLGLNPQDDVATMADGLHREDGRLMLVGHLPFLSRLAGLLVAGDPEAEVVRFRNAGVVRLTRHDETWTVEWVVPPEFVI